MRLFNRLTPCFRIPYVALLLLGAAFLPAFAQDEPFIFPAVSLKISLSGTFPGTAAVTPPEENAGADDDGPIHYPIKAIHEHVEGRVRLKMLIGADGTIKESQTLDNGGDERLLRASLEGLQRTGFTPGSVDGRPTEMWVTVEATFSMNGANGAEIVEMPELAFPAETALPSNEQRRDSNTDADTSGSDIKPVTIAPPPYPREIDHRIDTLPLSTDNAEPEYRPEELQRLLQYPEIAKRNGIEGRVEARALIDKYGNVLRVVIVSSSNTIFEDAVTKAISQLKFTPGRQNGQPTIAWKTIEARFTLGG